MFQLSAIPLNLRRFRFGTAAFLIPLFVRAIPEFIAGPYPIGWDTIAFYVPSTLDWASGKATFQFMLGEAPLIYAISVPLKLLSVNPVLTFKVLGPAIYGGLGFSVYRFSRVRLHWTERASLLGTLVAALYFITLRVGWDLHRNSLGFMFVLLALSESNVQRSKRGRAAVSVLLVLAVLSDQFSAVLAIWIFTFAVLRDIKQRSFGAFWRDLTSLLPASLLLIVVIASEAQATGYLFPRQPPILESWTPASSLGFLAFAYLPILPLAILGLRTLREVDLGLWVTLSLVGTLVTSLGFIGLSETGYRWALLASVPVCIWIAAGLKQLQSLTNVPWVIARKALPRLPGVFMAILIVLAALYTASPAQTPLPYFALHPSFLPTSMIQSTIPLSDYSTLINTLSWVGSNIGPGAALITHQSIYGWARAYLPSTVNVVNYGYGTPLDGVQAAHASGYQTILLIWWVNGTGWFGQTSVPASFAKIRSEGDMAIYDFVG